MKEILEEISKDLKRQTRLIRKLALNAEGEKKSGWKNFSALSPVISGLLIAGVGWYFTHVYNQQQLRLAEIQVIEKFSPQLLDTASEAKQMTALAAILSLEEEDLAVRTAGILSFKKKQLLLSKLFNQAVNSADHSLMKRILRTLPPGAMLENEFLEYPLEIAAANNDSETLEYLLENGFSPADHMWGADPALARAALKGFPDIVNILLRHGANPEMRNTNGETTLFLAVNEGHVEVVKALINHKVDLTIRNREGKDALLVAVDKSSSLYKNYPSGEIVKALLQGNADPNTHLPRTETRTALILSIQNGLFDAFCHLVDHGASLEPGNQYIKESAIHEAVTHGEVEMIRYLLKKGVSSNHRTSYGYTPLHYAKDEPLVVELLLKHNANPNGVSDDSTTVLASVLEYENSSEWADFNREKENDIYKVVELLIAAGANVNKPSGENSKIPLCIAASKRGSATLELLLKSGAAVNAVGDYEKNTALMNACAAGRWDNVELLLSKGADVLIKNQDGETALAIAQKYVDYSKDPSYEQIVQMLVKHYIQNGLDV